MSQDGFGKRIKRKIRRVGYVAVAFAALSIFSCWYVHRPYDTQLANYDRFGMLILPIESLGEATTILTDILGITGTDAHVLLGDFSEDDTDTFFAGTPTAADALLYLENKGYSVGYSDEKRVPLWVCYRLYEVENLESPPRPSRFLKDPRSLAGVAHDDYTRSGFDRGHMAPNYGIATRFGKEGQQQTFLMTNIVPQRPGLNRGPWRKLEWQVARYYAQTCGSVWIITGPIFEGEPSYLESGVQIPKGFYKIAVDIRANTIRVMPFVFYHDSLRHEWLRRHLVSVDQIENLTGLDFFPLLPDDQEATLESQAPTRLWRPTFQHIINQLRD